jgi:zinc protease
MAVVVVGDFDKYKMEKLIKEHFADIPSHKNEKPREIFSVPDQKNLSFTIVTDPEATGTQISFEHRANVEPQDKVKDYRHELVESLFNQMFTSRLSELSRKANPPFIYAYSSEGNFVRTKDFFTLGASVKDDGIETGFKTMLTEAQRVKKFGFTETELARAKQNLLSNIEEAYKENSKTESNVFADELVRHFLSGEPAPGIAYEFELYKQYLPGINLGEINKLSDDWIKEENSVITVSAPEKKDLKLPTEEELKNLFEKTLTAEVTPYNDVVSNLPLIDKAPVPSAAVKESLNKELNVTELKLANGVRIILKPTDFKNDEIQFYSFSPGGTSLCDSASYIAVSTATSLIQQSGVGNFTVDQLQKMLAGKVVNVSPYIGEITEGISGSSSVKDLETMFQLIYLYFTSPKIDSSSFVSYKSKMQTWLMNRNASPESALNDTLQVTLGNYNYRRMPWTESVLPQMDINKSLSFYKDRFADASGFTFVFVGNFDIKTIKPLLETYLGGLPAINRDDKWKNLKIFPPRGIINKQVYKGVEPKSTVNITFSGDYDWNTQNNYELYSMVDVLRIKLREILREDKSGTYGVSIRPSAVKYPEQKYILNISFGCAPDRVNDLVKTTFTELDSMKNFKVTDDYINKVKETQKKEFEVNLKENNFWLSSLQLYYFYGNDLSLLLKYPERVAGLSSSVVQKTAQKYFDDKNYVQVILYPAK